MRGRRGLFGVVVFAATALAFAPVVSAQGIDESFKADIEKLLDVTGGKQVGVQIAGLVSRQVLDGMRQSQGELPSRASEVVQRVLDEEFAKMFTGPNSMTPGLVAIYAKHYTPSDVRSLLAFYSTDVGKKVVATMPTIVQESAVVGQEWAATHMPNVMATLERRLRAEGLVK